jgi:hypothetical protein
MESRQDVLRRLYSELSAVLQKWMSEDLSQETHPAAYSIDKAVSRLRESFMWAQDASMQAAHFEKEVKPKLEVVK